MHEVLRSPGQPLDEATRAYFEPHFGHDFSGVRVHTDAKAAESARAVDALAYTVGHDVVFGSGRYSSGTSEGKRLLAHELAHVVQQRGGDAGPSLQRFTAGEKHQIAPTFTDMLAQIKTLIDKATTSSLLGDEAQPGLPGRDCRWNVGWTEDGRKAEEQAGDDKVAAPSSLPLYLSLRAHRHAAFLPTILSLEFLCGISEGYRSRGPTRRRRRWEGSTN